MFRNEIKNKLAETASGYLKIGVERFHNTISQNYESFQPALGNLSISIELMLKTLIAEKAFSFLYTNLPLELQVKLNYQTSSKINKPEEQGLSQFIFNTQPIDKCVSIFYTLYPEHKIKFKPYFNLFSTIRNISVHGSFPSFQKYDLVRIMYLAMNLTEILIQEKIYSFRYYKLTKEDERFLKNYNQERINRVKKEIESAKNKSRKIEQSWGFMFGMDDWELYNTSCPICTCEGTLTGSSEYGYEEDEMGGSEWLDFNADSFKCEECGLELLDSEELLLAGMETVYDRAGEMDKWYEEKEGII